LTITTKYNLHVSNSETEI